MTKAGKTVTMSYEDHQQLLLNATLHRQEIVSMGEKMVQQEVIMEKLIEERDDIVVIRAGRMCVDNDYVDPVEMHRHISAGYYHSPPKGRFVNFPRFVGGDEVAKELDEGFVEMHQEIRRLENLVKMNELHYKAEISQVHNRNYLIPWEVFGKLSKRFQRILEKLLFEHRRK